MEPNNGVFWFMMFVIWLCCRMWVDIHWTPLHMAGALAFGAVALKWIQKKDWQLSQWKKEAQNWRDDNGFAEGQALSEWEFSRFQTYLHDKKQEFLKIQDYKIFSITLFFVYTFVYSSEFR